MFLLENFIQAIAFTLDSLLSIYFWIVLISALLSWVNPDPRNPIVRFLGDVCRSWSRAASTCRRSSS